MIYLLYIVQFKLTNMHRLAPLQFNLRRAAKERIRRMVAPKSRRRDLEVPEYVRKEWDTGNRDNLAELLVQKNFDKDWLALVSHIVFVEVI